MTSDYFRTLRSVPFRGPGFRFKRDRRLDDGPARAGSSSATPSWRSRFNGDPSAIGTTIHLSGESYDIAGVASPGFEIRWPAKWTCGCRTSSSGT